MILEAKDLSFRYPRRGSVLEGARLTLRTGERIGLTAPSGRGKTTLCRLLAGFQRPDSGQVLLDGRPLSHYRSPCPVQLLWQHPEEAVDPLLRSRTTLKEAGPVERSVLEDLGIQESWLERYPSELSGGEIQRICIARALRPGVRFLLCDEITSMLDLVSQAQIWQSLLKRAAEQDLGLLVISHDTALLERVCTKVLSWEDITG